MGNALKRLLQRIGRPTTFLNMCMESEDHTRQWDCKTTTMGQVPFSFLNQFFLLFLLFSDYFLDEELNTVSINNKMYNNMVLCDNVILLI